MDVEVTETEIEAATDDLRHALLGMLDHGYTPSGYDRAVDCLADCERLADALAGEYDDETP